MEKKLFEIINSVGETLQGDLHIIDTSELYPEFEGEANYRVYHKRGYCFDVSKKVDKYDEETGKAKTWYYDFFAEWEGFDKIDVNKAYGLIKKELSAPLEEV